MSEEKEQTPDLLIQAIKENPVGAVQLNEGLLGWRKNEDRPGYDITLTEFLLIGKVSDKVWTDSVEFENLSHLVPAMRKNIDSKLAMGVRDEESGTLPL